MSDHETTPAEADIESRDEVIRVGYTVVREIGSSEDVLINLVGAVCQPRGGTFWPETQTVVYRPGTLPQESVAGSDLALLPHSDGSFELSPPEMLFLQCIKPDLPGYGESRIVTAVDIENSLSRQAVKVLSRSEFSFYRSSDGKTAKAVSQIISRDENGSPLIRFRHDERYRIQSSSPEGADAVTELSTLVNTPTIQRSVRLGIGDVLWLDNRRCLHARTALSGKVRRKLRTAWGDNPIDTQLARKRPSDH